MNLVIKIVHIYKRDKWRPRQTTQPEILAPECVTNVQNISSFFHIFFVVFTTSSSRNKGLKNTSIVI